MRSGADDLLWMPPAAQMDHASVISRSNLILPELGMPSFPEVYAGAASPAVSASSGYDQHRPRTPPPDLPSLLLDARIVYLGMPVRTRASVCRQFGEQGVGHPGYTLCHPPTIRNTISRDGGTRW